MDQKTHWEEIHGQKFQDVSWWQNPSDLWLDLIDKCQLDKSSSTIDVGAGASLLADALLDQGFTDVNILDISEDALKRVKERLGNRIPAENYYVSDVRNFYSGRKFDLWHDRAVFHFLTSAEDQAQYKESLLKNLDSGGYFVISTFAPDGPESCSGLTVARHDLESLESIFGENFETIYSDNRIHTTPWDSTQSFTSAVFKLAE